MVGGILVAKVFRSKAQCNIDATLWSVASDRQKNNVPELLPTRPRARHDRSGLVGES